MIFLGSAMKPLVEAFFDKATSTVSYVVYERPGSACAIIDSVLDYDPKSGHTLTASAERLVAFVQAKKLQVEWILETHVHADHMSAAAFLKSKVGGKIAIGEHIRSVQNIFKKIFNLESGFPVDGSQFDHLFAADEIFYIGNLKVQALHVPGHTPADMAYLIGDAIFTGDSLFMPDVGSARCDFPGGDARKLYQSVRRILSLPDETRVFICHDYPPEGREVRCESTIAAERAANIHLNDSVAEPAFVAMRLALDATLEMPSLILPSLQVNIRAGTLPSPEDNGVSYLKIPLNVL
jgi:glyoxylase-like metal-dependent hydrolase (beta-lactamase superfamily II)